MVAAKSRVERNRVEWSQLVCGWSRAQVDGADNGGIYAYSYSRFELLRA